MIRYLTFLIFILSVAIASGAILLAARLRNKYRTDIFSTLFYYHVFIFTFGFYGIWGQSVINLLLSRYITPELLKKFSEISLLLGLPFIVFAWLMLVRFSAYLSGREFKNLTVLYFLIANISVIFVVGYHVAGMEDSMPASLIKYYFIALSFIYTVVSALMILFPQKSGAMVSGRDRRIISSGILLLMVIQVTALIFYTTQIYLGLTFILLFFAGNSFVPLYLSYGTNFPEYKKEVIKKEEIGFEDFCKKYDVSPREKDIIREICNGLSNKEISDKLFISLQTVKDHTHRIYIKTNLKSRVQLINLVNEITDR